MSTAARLLILLGTISFATACDDKGVEEDSGGLSGDDGGGDDGGGDDGGGDDGGGDDGGDTGDTDEKIKGQVTGTVTVEVFETVDGVYTQVDIDERYDGVYPFGKVFVGAYQDPLGTGQERYRGIDTIDAPTFGADPFVLDVGVPEVGPVHIYAAVDADRNAFIDSDDPIGVWPVQVSIEDGSLTEDVNIRVVVNLDLLNRGGGSGCCGDGTSEGCTITVTGEVDVTRGFNGTGAAMILGTNGSGPHYADWFETTSTSDDSATADYAITMCHNAGSVQLVGAIDDNHNDLIDPDDTHGAYVTAPDEDGNPVHVETADLTDHTIQIPLFGPDGEPGDYGVQLVPFVRLSGTLSSALGTFDDLGAGTTVHIAGMKYRPNTSFGTSMFESGAYDYQSFDWAELAGQSEVAYELIVPANVELYLWAYADVDIDGTVNEAGEPVGSAPALEGAVTTGSGSMTIDIELDVP